MPIDDVNNLRTSLIPVIDDGRQLVAELGFRQRTVTLRTRTWSGGRPGSGTATDVDVELTPRPKVGEPPAKLIFDAPGKYEAGDLIVSKISITYAETDLMPVPVAGTETIWLITNATDGRAREYKIVGVPAKASFGYTVQLRRRNRAPVDP